MDAIGFDAYQHWFWRETEQFGPLTTGCGRLRGDTPLVVIALEGNGARPSHMGSGYNEEGKMFTLNTIENHAVCYGVCSFTSNSMMSNNPNSGFYETETSRTLDINCCNPACNQGGTVVVQCVEGQNCCTDTKKSFTLQAGRPDDHHIPDVCYPKITGALCANSHPGSYTGQDAFNDMLPVYRKDICDRSDNQLNDNNGRKYVLRRLTPLECCRLQGFPDWWTDGVEGSDSAIYKMWGNGIALPCAADILGRIAKELEDSL